MRKQSKTEQQIQKKTILMCYSFPYLFVYEFFGICFWFDGLFTYICVLFFASFQYYFTLFWFISMSKFETFMITEQTYFFWKKYFWAVCTGIHWMSISCSLHIQKSIGGKIVDYSQFWLSFFWFFFRLY